ncbi:paraquat-inducible protein A [Parendozoicomonas haliclonae]|uniref:Paraquat-inducible protein A n=1 Tax=Parendozoicomonas haliclonae TaxID=1960125 RepID=A0A1X7AJJ0_9GAMM|nr:paraquat-inducible protein A [Parendozoicomonas haliclonae]SMA46681.1 Paraquat-inducible protein A [Parendozoicomonas haliclonae]
MIRCRVCGINNEAEASRCQRCFSKVSWRIDNSVSKTWALLITALLLYIPANLLPIMSISKLEMVQLDTIFSGVISLASSGMVPIAILVFVASILVPLIKILGLATLLLNVQGVLHGNIMHLSRLYRFIEWVGRWSMLDIFMIAILVSVVQGRLLTIHAGPAATAFVSVVILTMLASRSFDLRLLWDRHLEEVRFSEEKQ